MEQTTPIEDLELSVRTMGLLQRLGITTVGELLAAPEIRVGKIRQARLVAAELGEVLEEIRGARDRIVVEAADAPIQAAGDLAARWAVISAWLGEHNPHMREGFRPPASADDVAAAEEALGRRLPDDYRRFLSLLVRWMAPP